MATVDEIRDLLRRFQDEKFSPKRRDVSKLIESPEEYRNFLLNCFDTWNEKTKTLYKHTSLIDIVDIAPQKVSSKLDGIINDLNELIKVFHLLGHAVGPVTFEKVTEDLRKNIRRTIESYTTLFEVIVKDLPYTADFAETILKNLRLQAMLGKWGNQNIRAEINQAATKPLPGKKEFTYTKHNKLSDELLDFGNHIWIILRVLFLILFYSFIQTEWTQAIEAVDTWVKTLLWIVLGFWLVKSIRERKLSVFLSGIIFFWNTIDMGLRAIAS